MFNSGKQSFFSRFASQSSALRDLEHRASAAIEAMKVKLTGKNVVGFDSESIDFILKLIVSSSHELGDIDPLQVLLGWIFIINSPDFELNIDNVNYKSSEIIRFLSQMSIPPTLSTKSGSKSSNIADHSRDDAGNAGEGNDFDRKEVSAIASSIKSSSLESSIKVDPVELLIEISKEIAREHVEQERKSKESILDAYVPLSASNAAEIPPEVFPSVQYAISAYNTELSEFLISLAGLGPTSANVVLAQTSSLPLIPAHLLLVDHKRKLIVLTIRGTASLADIIADIAGTTLDFADGVAHGGIVVSCNSFLSDSYFESAVVRDALLNGSPLFTREELAMRSFPEMNVPAAAVNSAAGITTSIDSSEESSKLEISPSETDVNHTSDSPKSSIASDIEPPAPEHHRGPYPGIPGLAAVLQRLVDKHPGYAVLLTGHSLGGGVATLLCCKLRQLLVFKECSCNLKSGVVVSGSSSSGGGHSHSDSTSAVVGPSASASEEKSASLESMYVGVDPSGAAHTENATSVAPARIIRACPLYAVSFGPPASTSPHLAGLLSMTDPEIDALTDGPSHNYHSCSQGFRPHMPIVTSVVHADDFIPRVTLGSVSRLHRRMSSPLLAACAREFVWSLGHQQLQRLQLFGQKSMEALRPPPSSPFFGAYMALTQLVKPVLSIEDKEKDAERRNSTASDRGRDKEGTSNSSSNANSQKSSANTSRAHSRSSTPSSSRQRNDSSSLSYLGLGLGHNHAHNHPAERDNVSVSSGGSGRERRRQVLDVEAMIASGRAIGADGGAFEFDNSRLAQALMAVQCQREAEEERLLHQTSASDDEDESLNAIQRDKSRKHLDLRTQALATFASARPPLQPHATHKEPTGSILLQYSVQNPERTEEGIVTPSPAQLLDADKEKDRDIPMARHALLPAISTPKKGRRHPGPITSTAPMELGPVLEPEEPHSFESPKESTESLPSKSVVAAAVQDSPPSDQTEGNHNELHTSRISRHLNLWVQRYTLPEQTLTVPGRIYYFDPVPQVEREKMVRARARAERLVRDARAAEARAAKASIDRERKLREKQAVAPSQTQPHEESTLETKDTKEKDEKKDKDDKKEKEKEKSSKFSFPSFSIPLPQSIASLTQVSQDYRQHPTYLAKMNEKKKQEEEAGVRGLPSNQPSSGGAAGSTTTTSVVSNPSSDAVTSSAPEPLLSIVPSPTNVIIQEPAESSPLKKEDSLDATIDRVINETVSSVTTMIGSFMENVMQSEDMRKLTGDRIIARSNVALPEKDLDEAIELPEIDLDANGVPVIHIVNPSSRVIVASGPLDSPISAVSVLSDTITVPALPLSSSLPNSDAQVPNLDPLSTPDLASSHRSVSEGVFPTQSGDKINVSEDLGTSVSNLCPDVSVGTEAVSLPSSSVVVPDLDSTGTTTNTPSNSSIPATASMSASSNSNGSGPLPQSPMLSLPPSHIPSYIVKVIPPKYFFNLNVTNQFFDHHDRSFYRACVADAQLAILSYADQRVASAAQAVADAEVHLATVTAAAQEGQPGTMEERLGKNYMESVRSARSLTTERSEELSLELEHLETVSREVSVISGAFDSIGRSGVKKSNPDLVS